MYLLDTNHCSRVLGGDERVMRRIDEVDPASVATSVIVRGELIYMAHNSDRVAENLSVVNSFIQGIQVYHVDGAVARRYGELKATLLARFGPKERTKRRRTSTVDLGFDENDLWIAATAMRFGLIVVSSDRDFARIAGATLLAHESWLTSDSS